jgi:hypothetical protein
MTWLPAFIRDGDHVPRILPFTPPAPISALPR